MKGLIGKVIAALGFASALTGVGGCYHLGDTYDPCYPERYWAASRQNLHAAIAPQVQNGRVLDQTMWNYHFEEGGDRLTPGGQEKLNYLARRRPMADPMIFLQTAHDLAYDPAKPDDYVSRRSQLDQKRVAAVKTYLTAYTAGGPAAPFEVQVHNPPDVSIAGVEADVALRQIYTSPRATLPGTGGTSGSGGGGASGGGGR